MKQQLKQNKRLNNMHLLKMLSIINVICGIFWVPALILNILSAFNVMIPLIIPIANASLFVGGLFGFGFAIFILYCANKYPTEKHSFAIRTILVLLIFINFLILIVGIILILFSFGITIPFGSGVIVRLAYLLVIIFGPLSTALLIIVDVLTIKTYNSIKSWLTKLLRKK